VRLKPIFDTNVFGHVESGLIPSSQWEQLLAHRPRHGWPLSQVTALELLTSLHFGASDKFRSVKRRIEFAQQLSKGRVLEDPRILICRHVLHIPFPADKVAPAAAVLARYLDVVRRSATMEQLFRGGVPYRGKRVQVADLSAFAGLMGDVKRQWVAAVENMATETYPDWRALFQRSGRWRLPSELRKELNPVQAWKGPRVDFIKGLLQWLHAAVDQKVIELMCTKLNAVLEFAVFVTREFLLGNYSLEKHDSDIFDQFQLQYLAMSEFVVVSGDADLLLRTKRSAQASRIMSFDQFLRTI
jgi:hypothetical protein